MICAIARISYHPHQGPRRLSMKNKTWISVFTGLCLLPVLLPVGVKAQTHFTDCVASFFNATIIIPAEGLPLAVGDEVAVFSPEGLCAGVVTVDGNNTAIVVAGDDDSTLPIEGLRVGGCSNEYLYYLRIYPLSEIKLKPLFLETFLY